MSFPELWNCDLIASPYSLLFVALVVVALLYAFEDDFAVFCVGGEVVTKQVAQFEVVDG